MNYLERKKQELKNEEVIRNKIANIWGNPAYYKMIDEMALKFHDRISKKRRLPYPVITYIGTNYKGETSVSLDSPWVNMSYEDILEEDTLRLGYNNKVSATISEEVVIEGIKFYIEADVSDNIPEADMYLLSQLGKVETETRTTTTVFCPNN